MGAQKPTRARTDTNLTMAEIAPRSAPFPTIALRSEPGGLVDLAPEPLIQGLIPRHHEPPRVMVKSPLRILAVSPLSTGFATVSALKPRKFPDVLAS